MGFFFGCLSPVGWQIHSGPNFDYAHSIRTNARSIKGRIVGWRLSFGCGIWPQMGLALYQAVACG